MTEDEKFVREHWDRVRLDRDFGFHLWLGSSRGAPYLFSRDQDDVTVAWSEAAEFTRQRLEEIRQVEEEIGFLESLAPDLTAETFGRANLWVDSDGDEAFAPSWVKDCAVDQCRRNRILAREQAALSELKKGMKN